MYNDVVHIAKGIQSDPCKVQLFWNETLNCNNQPKKERNEGWQIGTAEIKSKRGRNEF